jgi:hypothetical protein
MSDLMINSDLASSGKASHKSIGANGSFWLPPKMQSMSFDSSLKKLSTSSKTSFPSSSDKAVSTSGSFNSVKSNLTNQNQSILRNADFFENRPEETQAKYPQSSSSPFRPSVQDIRSAPSRMNHSIPTAVNASSAMISSSEAITHPVPLPHLTNAKNGKSGFASFLPPAPKNNGAKNAKFIVSEFTKDAFLSTQSDFPKTSLSEDEVFDFIRSYQGGSLSFGASKKGVIRFAFTLEDGSSVSVRLEQKSENLQICFISETVSALESLQSKFTSFTEDHGSFSGATPVPLFFSSYSEMDACLLNSQ